jgi:PleD family two-component response regulator
LTPDTDANGIFSIANYLCQEVYGLALAHDDSPLGRVSISVGVATASAKESMSPERLVQRAADALASAKLRGHHCVVAA